MEKAILRAFGPPANSVSGTGGGVGGGMALAALPGAGGQARAEEADVAASQGTCGAQSRAGAGGSYSPFDNHVEDFVGYYAYLAVQHQVIQHLGGAGPHNAGHWAQTQERVFKSMSVSMVPMGPNLFGDQIKVSMVKDRGGIRAAFFVDLMFSLRAGFLVLYDSQHKSRESAHDANEALAVILGISPVPARDGHAEAFPGLPADYRHRAPLSQAIHRWVQFSHKHNKLQVGEDYTMEVGGKDRCFHFVSGVRNALGNVMTLADTPAERFRRVNQATEDESWQHLHSASLLGVIPLFDFEAQFPPRAQATPSADEARQFLREILGPHAGGAAAAGLQAGVGSSEGGRAGGQSGSNGRPAASSAAVGRVDPEALSRPPAPQSKTFFLPMEPTCCLGYPHEPRTCVVMVVLLHHREDDLALASRTLTVFTRSHAASLAPPAQWPDFVPHTVNLTADTVLLVNGDLGVCHPTSCVL